MTQDEQHLDQSQQLQNNQRCSSIDNTQPTIPIDDDIIITTSSSITTQTTPELTTTTTTTLLIDGKLKYNLEEEKNTKIDFITITDSNRSSEDNFNINNNNNNIPTKNFDSISENKNNYSENNQLELSSTLSLSSSSPLNDFNENVIIPESKNKIIQNKNTDDVISDTILVNTTLEKDAAINRTHQLNLNDESAQNKTENILNENSDSSPNNNTTSAILPNVTATTTTANSIPSEVVSKIETNELKLNQTDFKDSLNKSVVSAVNVNSKIDTINLLQNNEILQEQLIITKNNNINIDNNNKLYENILKNQNLLEIKNNDENKIIEKFNNINYDDEKFNDKTVNLNESSDGNSNSKNFKLNDKSDTIKLNDNLNIIKSENNNNNNKSDLNCIKEESKGLDNEINLKLIDAKNNEFNENLKQAQGIFNVPIQNNKILQEQEITKNNLNFNQSTNRSNDINEFNSLNKNKLIDGQSDNNNNNNNNNNSNNINDKDKYKSIRQKTLSQDDEDPIARLNRLRANISNALREVKGVIRQYSSEQSIEIEDKLIGNRSISNRRLLKQKKLSDDFKINQIEEDNIMAPIPIADDNKPVQFRFLRKIRRSSNNINDDQKDNEDNQSNEINNNNRNKSDTNELSSENNLQNLNENKTENNNNNNNEVIKNEELIKINIDDNSKSDLIKQSNVSKTTTVIHDDKNDNQEKVQSNNNKILNDPKEKDNNKIGDNNLINKNQNFPEKVEEKNEKIKKTVIKKQISESAEEKVKKLLTKKPPVTESETKQLNNTNNGGVKPKIKKIKKINSLDKEINDLNGNDKPKRIKLKKQISVDEKTLIQNQLSESKTSELLELLKESEEIPILIASNNTKKSTESNLKKRNSIEINSNNSLNKLKKEEITQTDIVISDKTLKSDETISNKTSSNSKDLDGFTVLLSREVIVSKVVVPQGSIEFDNPELIEFPKGDSNCKVTSEIVLNNAETREKAGNLTNISNLNKTEPSKRMTISENPLIINRRASVAVTDAKKIEGEYKQKVKTNITTQQRRASQIESVKTTPINKTVSTKTKPLTKITPPIDSPSDKKEIVAKPNSITNIQNTSPVSVQKTNSGDLPKQTSKMTTIISNNTAEKDVKRVTSPQKEILNKSPQPVPKKAAAKISPTVKEVTVQKMNTEVKKTVTKTVPKTFTVSRVREPLSPQKSSSPVKVISSAKDVQKNDGTKLAPNTTIITSKTKENLPVSKSIETAPKKVVSTENSIDKKSSEKQLDIKTTKDANNASVQKNNSAEIVIISKEVLPHKETTAQLLTEKKQNEIPKSNLNANVVTNNKNTDLSSVSKTAEVSKTFDNSKANSTTSSVELQTEDKIKRTETINITSNTSTIHNNLITKTAEVVVTQKEILQEKDVIAKSAVSAQSSTKQEEKLKIQELENIEKRVIQETKISQQQENKIEIPTEKLKEQSKIVEIAISGSDEVSQHKIASEIVTAEQNKIENFEFSKDSLETNSVNQQTNQENSTNLVTSQVAITTEEVHIKSEDETEINLIDESKLNVYVSERLHESSHSENETTEDEHYTSESTTETTDTDGTGDNIKIKSAKKRKALKKVVIKRVKRRLSITDGPPRPISPTNSEPQPEPEICEKEIYEEDKTLNDVREEDVDEPEILIKIPSKPCIRPRAFEPDELVLYGERFKKTQIKWRKARIVERITSISYKIHLGEDEEDKTVHLSFLKRDTGKRISFGGKEYLEIDYAQIEADEEKYNRPYSIWDRA